MEQKQPKKRSFNSINLRAWVLLVAVFMVGFVILIVRLFTIQIIDGDYYKTQVLRQQTSMVTTTAKRGTIYDRNEKVLAQSATVWNVCISPIEIKEEQWDIIANDLGEILEIEPAEILSHRGKETYYVPIKKGVDNTVREKVATYIKESDMKLRSIFFEEVPKRYYTYDSLASTILGFTDGEDKGAYGLEAYYESVLAGTPGVSVTGGDNTAQSFKAEDGNSVMLTIDENIQSILERHLEMAIVEHQVKNKACAVFMNMKTGEILGMATKDDFNPNDAFTLANPADQAIIDELDPDDPEYETQLNDFRYLQWQNKAITDTYEPGSVYKIITAAIALEEERSSLGDQFYCTGSVKVADRTMNCWWLQGHGPQDFNDIMRNSCNPAFVELGRKNGADLTAKYRTDFGFGKVTGIDLPAEVEGIAHSKIGEVQLASTSFGQSFTVTPLQLLTGVSAAVNDGYLVQPHIVKQIMDSQGNVVETIQPVVKCLVISKDTSDKFKGLVEQVVANGSGRNAAVPGYRIGGKTGTSEKLDIKALEGRKAYVLSFAGFAPMEDPTYSLLIVLDEPVLANPLASVIAAPVAGAIFQEALPYLGVEPNFSDAETSQQSVKVPYLLGKKPHDAQAELTSLGLKTRIIGEGKEVIRQMPLGDQQIAKGGVVTLYVSEEELNPNVIVPDLTYLTAEQVEKKLHDLGLNAVIQGRTEDSSSVVLEQWPLPGERLTTGDIVQVSLVPGSNLKDIEVQQPVQHADPEEEAPLEDEEDFDNEE